MSQSPKVTGDSNLLNFYWEDYLIAAKVDRLKSNSDHEVRGEVVFTSHDPTSAGHLRQTRLILTSTSAKNAFVKSLSERIPSEDVPWDTIVETLCVIVLERFRMGTPLITVDGDIDVEAQKGVNEAAEYEEYKVEFDQDGTEAGADAIDEIIQKEIIEESSLTKK